MRALNRHYSSKKYNSRNEFLRQNIKCVFISYQNKDKVSAKKVADYILNAGIDIYFDEYDSDLKFSNQTNNPKKVTNALIKGINNSSHMLVLVSPSTLKSQWVPFEIGYGYDKTDLAVLTLKGIPKKTLPEYLRTAKIIRDIDDLNNMISSLSKYYWDDLKKNGKIKDYNDSSNSLLNVMNSIISDTY